MRSDDGSQISKLHAAEWVTDPQMDPPVEEAAKEEETAMPTEDEHKNESNRTELRL